MNEIFFDKIHFKCVSLFKAREIADCNFKLHKSVEFLDLSTTYVPRVFEISPVQFIFTKEDLRKRFIPERQILYTFHLDLPTELENSLFGKKTIGVIWNAIHLRKIHVRDRVFNKYLERHIVWAIKCEKRNKIEKLRSYMKILKLLNFEDFEPVVYLYDNILPILCDENCTDSELVKDFVTMLDFAGWLCHSPAREMPKVLEFVLSQAQRARYINELWLPPFTETYPVNICLLTGKMHYLLLLIKYGADTSVLLDMDFEEHTEHSAVFDTASDEGVLSYPRVFRIFQVFCGFELYRPNFPVGLRCLWMSIKDPFLSISEIVSTLTPMLPQETAPRLIEYYENSIGRSCSLRPTPRSLKDLCRVKIRGLLNDNHQLPFGISHLTLPKSVQSYLNLER